MIILSKLPVAPTFIKWGTHSLSHPRGYRKARKKWKDNVYPVRLRPVQYDDLKPGTVFVPDIKDQMMWDEPSFYLMKQAGHNLYLTGDDELPLAVDNNSYTEVFEVIR